VNYIDTAYMYCRGQSEVVVGKALKGWRERIKLSTKLPLNQVKSRDDYRRLLDEQLTKLDTDWIDFYHFHGLSGPKWCDVVQAFDLVEEMAKARDEGLIRHVSFSFHDKPEAMRAFIDSGVFASVLCQYNLLDRANEDAMAHAREQGLGVVVMGPVGGGRLGSPRDYIEAAVDGKASTPEIALRFVLSNPNVSCALSGMSTMEQVEENVAVAADLGPLSKEQKSHVEEVLASRKKLADLYCTGCGYCMPCPHGVNIPVCFESMINHRVYEFTSAAMRKYRAIGDQWIPGKRADACVACGECEEKCPQNIPIRQQLKEVDATLGPLL
jgi:predicted aldo/keto reductase-like oxidoreductase